ncbi:MAG: hypothetical protein BGO88_08050 [Flavobacterium sp. 38-13]|nr:hypothetical protein ASG38_11325 [Flavobacterium sp. Leaf359]OJX51129.1 MAG: hypothetical protein BGO88_08050 [Flavobacterium sp. 38-13]PZQ92488.1 MAG: hypothetical protein DI548_00715 [Flavobacterium johnsoniae]
MLLFWRISKLQIPSSGQGLSILVFLLLFAMVLEVLVLQQAMTNPISGKRIYFFINFVFLILKIAKRKPIIFR